MRIILFSLLLVACKQPAPQSRPVSDPAAPLSSWTVRGCAEAALKPETRFPAKGEFKGETDESLPGISEILGAGDSIVYVRYVHHGCCRKVRITPAQSGSVITFTEYWWGQVCKCMCNSSLRAVVRGLPPGTYQVFGVETGTDIITDQPAPGRDTVLLRTIELK